MACYVVFLLQDKLVQHRIHKNVDILKLHLKKSAIRVLGTDDDLKHSSTTVAKLFETILSRYQTDCHKIPTSSPKKSWKHAWEQAGLLYTSSVRRDESHFLGSWRKAVWPKFGKLKTSKNEQRGCNPRTHRECDKRSKINLPLLLFGHFLI